ncbi:hypothetical protein D9M71_435850 [compost metagenome]
MPDPAAERQPAGEVAGVEQQALAHADLVVVALQDAEVEHQQEHDDGEEGQPEPAGRAKEWSGEE